LFFKVLKGIKRRISRHIQLINKYKASETIFIYQMGKVGSTTLEHSLPNAVHLHAFYNKNHTCPVRLRGLAKFGFLHFVYRLEQGIVSYFLRSAFKQRKKTKIITLVREVKARNISMFFHDLDAYLFAAHTNCLNTREVPLPTRCQSSEMLTDVFNHEFDHQYALKWFDEEFLPMTGINIYQCDFDINKGIGFAKNDTVEVACIRTDKLTNNLAALSDFIGQNIQLANANQADDKWYRDIYKDFVANYSIPLELQNKIENSRFNRHFFDETNKQ